MLPQPARPRLVRRRCKAKLDGRLFPWPPTLVTMEIRALDVLDDDVFHRYYEIGRAAELFERPDAPFWAEPEVAVLFRRTDEGETWTAYGAFEGDEMVGTGFTVRPLLDNTDKVFTSVFVAPELRGRGIGGALLEFLVQAARDEGRSLVLLETVYDFDRRETHPHRRFAEKHGFTLATTEIARRLDLPVDESQLQAWIDEAAAHHDGYRVETHVGDLPERIVAGFCEVTNQLAVDAPTGSIDFEAEAMTPEIWRGREAAFKEQQRTLFNTIALDAHGTVVGVTTLVVPDLDPTKLFQWATLVQRDHRGHRLGLALKARNLLEVQRAHPERQVVHTCNEETNGPMVGINERMGFRPVEIMAGFSRNVS
jgi:GNAT superfamily N-acetyltransferase